MAVPNQFVDITTERNLPVSYIVSTTPSLVVGGYNCESAPPLSEIASLAGVSLLTVVVLGIHLARVRYYTQYGVEAGVFILDR
jgi:hypothetical protein